MKPKIASIATNLKPFNRLIKRFLILSNMSPPYDKSLMLLVSSLMQPQRESTKNKITLAIPKVKRVFIPRTKSDQKGVAYILFTFISRVSYIVVIYCLVTTKELILLNIVCGVIKGYYLAIRSITKVEYLPALYFLYTFVLLSTFYIQPLTISLQE